MDFAPLTSDDFQNGDDNMGDARVSNLKTNHPLTNDAEFFPWVKRSWSLAFQINHECTLTGRPAGGLMWAGLANSFYWIDPTTGIGGVFLSQIFPFADSGSVPTGRSTTSRQRYTTACAETKVPAPDVPEALPPRGGGAA